MGAKSVYSLEDIDAMSYVYRQNGPGPFIAQGSMKLIQPYDYIGNQILTFFNYKNRIFWGRFEARPAGNLRTYFRKRPLQIGRLLQPSFGKDLIKFDIDNLPKVYVYRDGVCRDTNILQSEFWTFTSDSRFINVTKNYGGRNWIQRRIFGESDIFF
jgi:hypothetical protein